MRRFITTVSMMEPFLQKSPLLYPRQEPGQKKEEVTPRPVSSQPGYKAGQKVSVCMFGMQDYMKGNVECYIRETNCPTAKATRLRTMSLVVSVGLMDLALSMVPMIHANGIRRKEIRVKRVWKMSINITYWRSITYSFSLISFSSLTLNERATGKKGSWTKLRGGKAQRNEPKLIS